MLQSFAQDFAWLLPLRSCRQRGSTLCLMMFLCYFFAVFFAAVFFVAVFLAADFFFAAGARRLAGAGAVPLCEAGAAAAVAPFALRSASVISRCAMRR